MRRIKLNREEQANIGKEQVASALMIHFLTCHGIFQLIDDMERLLLLD